jgi:hypothetical protein
MADTLRNETGPSIFDARTERQAHAEIDGMIARANGAATHTDCYSDFLAYKRRVETATRQFCKCGGLGPEDHGVCPACLVAWAVGVGK